MDIFHMWIAPYSVFDEELVRDHATVKVFCLLKTQDFVERHADYHVVNLGKAVSLS